MEDLQKALDAANEQLAAHKVLLQKANNEVDINKDLLAREQAERQKHVDAYHAIKNQTNKSLIDNADNQKRADLYAAQVEQLKQEAHQKDLQILQLQDQIASLKSKHLDEVGNLQVKIDDLANRSKSK